MNNTTNKAWKWVLKKTRTIFIAGLLVTVPIGLTIWIFYWLFTNIDGWLQPLIQQVFGRPIQGVGFGIIIVLIFIVGAIMTNVVGRRIVRWSERMLGRVPIARRLYVALKEVAQSFSNPEATGFMHVVLVEFPAKGMKTIGFVTNETTDEDGRKVINVFIPTSPNPTTGFLEIVREEDIIRTSITVEDALKMVVSAGRMSPKNLGENITAGKKPTEVIE
ncbi:MAG: DUF502 domain-containing protein [Dehalococcoidia bacterium]|nr:DUF502 domain-containing protein [Dehalococcoidia bacterium]